MAIKLQSLLSKRAWDKILREYTYNPAEDNRQKMVDRYREKYGERDTSVRVANRRNIKFNMKLIVTTIVSYLVTNAPYKTGNLKLNGIRYKTSSNLGVIAIGSPSAPYGVHLNFNENSTEYGWIDTALQGAMNDINALKLDNSVDIQLQDLLEYGYWQIRVEIN